MQCSSLIGYHATWSSAADRIDRNGFAVGSLKWDWLGTGAYFWIENERMAHFWARKLVGLDPRRASTDTPVVLECLIKTGACLNLADTEHVFMLRDFMDDYAPASVTGVTNEEAKAGHPLAGEVVYRWLDHKIIDAFDDFNGGIFDTVLGAFNNGEPIYKNSAIMQYTTIQLAVREKALRDITVRSRKAAELTG